jgi:hypothetical protein
MDDLLKEIAAEKERIENTLNALEKTLRRKRRTFPELAAIATCLHNCYSGMENLLKRVLKHINVPLPDSTTSHKDLLALAVEQKMITSELSEALDEYRAFRHFLCTAMAFFYRKHHYSLSLKTFPKFGIALSPKLLAFVNSLRN